MRLLQCWLTLRLLNQNLRLGRRLNVGWKRLLVLRLRRLRHRLELYNRSRHCRRLDDYDRGRRNCLRRCCSQ